VESAEEKQRREELERHLAEARQKKEAKKARKIRL